MTMYKGIHVREDNKMDEYIVDEMSSDYKYLLQQVEGKIVMDVGANIGAFSSRALDNGAERVIAIEPEPGNLVFLDRNTKEYGRRVEVYPGVIGNKDGRATLMVNEGSNKGLHSINTDSLVAREKDYHTVDVPMFDFRTILDVHKPEVLKIDIEGGELLIIDILTDLPDYIKHIAIEFDAIEDKYIPILQYLATNFKDAERNKFFTGSRL